MINYGIVKKAQRLYESGELSLKDIAKELGFSYPTIIRLKKRYRWKTPLFPRYRQCYRKPPRPKFKIGKHGILWIAYMYSVQEKPIQEIIQAYKISLATFYFYRERFKFPPIGKYGDIPFDAFTRRFKLTDPGLR